MRRRVGNVCALWACLGAIGCSNPASGGGGSAADGGAKSDVYLVSPDVDASSAAETDGTSPLFDVFFDDTSFVCVSGSIACFNETTAKVCVDKAWTLKEQCINGDVCVGGTCVTPGTCPANAVIGCDAFAAEVHCAADGKSTFKVPCTGSQLCVDGKCVTTVCTPYTAECVATSKTKAHVCQPDGQAWGPETECKIGSFCAGGKCISGCEQGLKFGGNVGCDYWSVDLDNDSQKNPATGTQADMVPHSIVVANPGQFDAELTFTVAASCADGSACTPSATTCNGKKGTVCGTAAAKPYDLVFSDNVVPAGKSKEFKMPVMNVSGSAITPKAIHVKSTQPIIAFQFNPFNSEGAASNDGSLLLPQNSLGKNYYAMVPAQSRGAFPALGIPANNGFVAIVGTQAGNPTNVDFTPNVACIADGANGVPQDGTKPKSLAAGTTYTFSLKQFEVLNIEAAPTNDIVPSGKGPQSLPNMTGARIVADKPIAVFSGHQVTGLEDDFRFSQSTGSESTWDTCCTEHVEEQLMPVEFWGNEAWCVKAKPRGSEVDEWVVIAGEDNIKLATIPPIKGLDGATITKAGQKVRAQTDESFMLTASGKVQVTQLLMSAGQVEAKNNGVSATLGDASMAIVPPKKQYRTEYGVLTADGYSANYASVVRPKGLAITMDGGTLPAGFQPFGDGSWEYAYVTMQKGSHTFEADGSTPFGVMVYGYGGVTAYSYPGGMSLK